MITYIDRYSKEDFKFKEADFYGFSDDLHKVRGYALFNNGKEELMFNFEYYLSTHEIQLQLNTHKLKPEETIFAYQSFIEEIQPIILSYLKKEKLVVKIASTVGPIRLTKKPLMIVHNLNKKEVYTEEEFKELYEKTKRLDEAKEKYKNKRKSINTFIEKKMSGASDTSKRTYYYSLERFFEFIFFKKQDKFPDYDEYVINDFIESLRSRDRKKEASRYYVERLLAAIFKYSQFINKKLDFELIIDPNPKDLRQVAPKSLGDEAVQKLHDELFLALGKEKEKQAKNKMKNGMGSYSRIRDKMRNYVVFRIMIQTGMRISEVLDLHFEDIHFGKRAETKYIHVAAGKGNEERNVPMVDELRDIIQQYIDFRKEYDEIIEIEKIQFAMRFERASFVSLLSKDDQVAYQRITEEMAAVKGKDTNKMHQLDLELMNLYDDALSKSVKRIIEEREPHLFISNRGVRVSNDTFMKMFKKHDISSHQLRHTAIKTMVDAGVPINRIQAFSGHKSADMILRYSQPTLEEVAQAVEETQSKFGKQKL